MELFGIKVLESDWIDNAEESVQYNDVKFHLKSLSQYDGKTVEVLHDWAIKIWDDEGNIIDEFYLIENEEFRATLYNMYPLK